MKRSKAGEPSQIMQQQQQARRPPVAQAPGPPAAQVPQPGMRMVAPPQMGQPMPMNMQGPVQNKRPKRQTGDKLIAPQVRELVPESQAYMDLLAFENKLDATIARKKLDVQEALKRPQKIRRRLRIYVSHTYIPSRAPEEGQEAALPMWELRVEGKLLDEQGALQSDQQAQAKLPKRKFSSFFKSLVIELDKDLYGPDQHLVEWHRSQQSHETDGFQVKRAGDRDVSCKILLLLDYQPMKYKLHPKLARLLGIHTETRPKIIEALWQYVKTHKLQDPQERDYINCDKHLQAIFDKERMRFMEIPQRLQSLLMQPDPITLTHNITMNCPDEKKTMMYDIDVEIEDPLKSQMTQFVMSQMNYTEIGALDERIYNTVDQINEIKLRRDFYLGFAQSPVEFIQKWLISQSADLKAMRGEDASDSNSEVARRSVYYVQSSIEEAVHRYYYAKVQQKRAELENSLGIRNQ